MRNWNISCRMVGEDELRKQFAIETDSATTTGARLDRGILIESNQSDDLQYALEQLSLKQVGQIAVAGCPDSARGTVREIVYYRHYKHYSANRWAVVWPQALPISDQVWTLTEHLLAAPLAASIEFVDGSSLPLPAAADGIFRVVINASSGPDCSARSETNVHLPEMLWGVPLTAEQRLVHKASGRGYCVVADNGLAIAELVGCNLYILFDIFAPKAESNWAVLYTLVLNKIAADGQLSRANSIARILADQLGDSASSPDSVNPPAHNWTVDVSAIAGAYGTSPEKAWSEAMSFLCLNLIAPAIASNIVVCKGSRQSATPDIQHDAFEIVLHSALVPLPEAPQELAAIAAPTPPEIFGLPAVPGTLVLPFSGAGLPLIDGEGTIVGELLERKLYVLVALGSSDEMLDIVRTTRFLFALRTVHLERMEQQSATSGSAPGTGFVHHCSALVERVARLEYMSPSKAQLESGLSESCYLSQLRRQWRRLRIGCSREEQAFLRNQAAPQEVLGEEFDRLMDLASVVAVEVVPGQLKVTTTVLYCRHPVTGSLHEIGAFDILIPTEGGDIRWLNRTRQVTGYSTSMQAPHVFADGTACLGNVKDLFPRLIAQRDFSSALQVAIAFVEAVNVNDSAGQFIDRWPLVKQ